MKIIINPKYEYLREDILQIPKEFDKQTGEILYEARNILKSVELGGIKVVIKSFHQPKFFNRIIYSFIRKSKALRSYLFSEKLLECNIPAPTPIACIINFKNGLITNSYYINKYEEADTVRELMGGSVKGNEDLLNDFTDFLIHTHYQGILHLDLSPGNILFKKGSNGKYKFFLIDVNRMKLDTYVGMKEASHNLRRLCTSSEISGYIARRYAQHKGWDIGKMERMVQHDSDRFFKKFFFHRAATRSKAPHIRLVILRFRLFLFIRVHFLSTQSKLSATFYQKEAFIYINYLKDYDFRKIFYPDYIGKH